MKGTNSRLWSPVGVRPTAPRQTQYEWAYLFGVVTPQNGKSSGLVMPHADTEAFGHMLRTAAKELLEEDEVLMLIVDRAGWHFSKELRVPRNVVLVPLPPYSPELNPIEQVWAVMRQRHLSNRVFENVKDLEDAVSAAWLKVTDDHAGIQRLTSRAWAKPCDN